MRRRRSLLGGPGTSAASSSTPTDKAAASSTPDKKGILSIMTEIQSILAKDLTDLQIQVARLVQVQDFIRVYVEDPEAKPGVRRSIYVA